jgi:hypothetical protein
MPVMARTCDVYTSVADPEFEMVKKSRTGFSMNIPDYISESVETIL